jgi:hypothetical protein
MPRTPKLLFRTQEMIAECSMLTIGVALNALVIIYWLSYRVADTSDQISVGMDEILFYRGILPDSFLNLK